MVAVANYMNRLIPRSDYLEILFIKFTITYVTAVVVAFDVVDIFSTVEFEIHSIIVDATIVELLLVSEASTTHNLTILYGIFSSHKNNSILLLSKRDTFSIFFIMFLPAILAPQFSSV
jgi:hypothetical protein